MELTILMPCLNEAETIVACIQKANAFLEQEKIDGEILIADNGSTDNSQELAQKHGARVIHAEHRGYGAALLAGINHAKGKYIIMGDADDSYDFLHLLTFIEKLRQGNDLVMGNRFKGGIKDGAMPFLNRYLGNPVLSFVGRLFFSCDIGDFHCGLRGFNREKINSLQLKAPGMEFASEMAIKAVLANIKITEVPTTLSPDGRSRAPHLKRWRDGWRHLRLLLLFSPRWLFFYPGIILSFLGFLLMLVLMITPIKLGNIEFGIHTLLYSGAFFVAGLQALSFSLFSEIACGLTQRTGQRSIFSKFINRFSLEKGMTLGGLLILIGLIGSISALILWSHTQFGSLIPTKMMRLTIPSAFFIIAGLQITFSSFFLQLLKLSHEKI